MKVALFQGNFRVGDFAGNAEKIIRASHTAKARGADLLLTPELCLSGYCPEDLLLRPDFLAASDRVLRSLAQEVVIPVLVGHPAAEGERIFNRASLVAEGNVFGHHDKMCLPNYGVFDDLRYFSPGTAPFVFSLCKVKAAALICEDIWHPGPALAARARGAKALLVLNASPYHLQKTHTRLAIARSRAREAGLDVLFLNTVGGQDDLVFDGGSFFLDAQGEIKARFPLFQEFLGIVCLGEEDKSSGFFAEGLGEEEEIYQALCLALADYVGKNGFASVLVGVSGGVDSALTLTICRDALGPGQVKGVFMPSRYTSAMSGEDALALSQNLGVELLNLGLERVFEAFLQELSPHFLGLAPDITEENLQARIRGTLLMALANKFKSLVVATGNKSEMATGYATLYGDMAGGFALLKDVSKAWVYRLCRWRNNQNRVIPERVLFRPPSAELRHEQVDEDTLPPYERLDAILENYVERDLGLEDLVSEGFSREEAARVIRMVEKNEYKRRQAPIGPKMSVRAFGRDRRLPVTHHFLPES